jgi:hypothetical protein
MARRRIIKRKGTDKFSGRTKIKKGVIAAGFEIVHKITEKRWLTVSNVRPQNMFDLISQYNRGRYGWAQVRVKIKAYKEGCKVKRSKRGEIHGIVK